MSLWMLHELADALGLVWDGPDVAVTGVSIDSRTVQPGDVFIALSGTPSGGFNSSFESSGDGHVYVADAAAKGAVAAIVAHAVEEVDMPQLVVADTLMDGLWKLGEASRARFGGKVIGLTGSAGKTTTKEFLAGMLAAAGETTAAVGSYNNFWGVPLTLARMPRAAAFAVVEIGMNVPGEIGRLSALAKPDVALVVNVKPVHVGGVGSLEAVRREKLAIAEGLVAGGVLVVPEGLEVDSKALRFDPTAPLPVEIIEPSPARAACANAALAAAQQVADITPAMLEALAKVGVLPGRGQVETVGGVVVIDDSFNGNPASMAAALEGLKARAVQGRRIAVLGDMLELGPEEGRYHEELAEACAGVDGVFAIGPLMKSLYDNLQPAQQWGYHAQPASFDPAVVAARLQPGDAVVVKGSKASLYVHGVVPRLKAYLAKV